MLHLCQRAGLQLVVSFSIPACIGLMTGPSLGNQNYGSDVDVDKRALEFDNSLITVCMNRGNVRSGCGLLEARRVGDEKSGQKCYSRCSGRHCSDLSHHICFRLYFKIIKSKLLESPLPNK